MARMTYIEHGGTAHCLDIPDGYSVMEGAVKNGVAGIDADCGGSCACATCLVFVDPAWRDRLPAPDDMEEAMLEIADHGGAGARLSCQIRVGAETEGLVVVMPASQR
jgi:2Fe-2S ferredoxin